MLNHSAADFKIVYLLGAGFSSAKAPLTAELGEKLKNTFPEGIREKFNFTSDNIELFFTKLDLEILRLKQLKQDSSKLEEIRRVGSDKIVDIFATKKLFCVKDNEIEISDSANRICKTLFCRNDTILTVNYDCALENILFVQNKWSSIGGWGKNFRFNEDIENRN